MTVSETVRRPDIYRRLRRRCVVNVETGCWEWTGAKSKNGYGRIKVDGRLALTHRVAAYCAGVGDQIFATITGECVMHTCDNKACCNPNHLIDASRRDNMRDCAAKGRVYGQKAQSASPTLPGRTPTRSDYESIRIRRLNHSDAADKNKRTSGVKNSVSPGDTPDQIVRKWLRGL